MKNKVTQIQSYLSTDLFFEFFGFIFCLEGERSLNPTINPYLPYVDIMTPTYPL